MRVFGSGQLAETSPFVDYDGRAESEPVFAAEPADDAMSDAADSADDPLAPTIQWEWRYQYDAFGNLKEHRRDFPDSTHQTRTFAIDVQKNRLSSATYAATGDLVSWAGGSYVYDESGDLQQVGTDIVHIYTAGGERIGILQMAAPGYVERYRLRSPGGQVLREWLRVPGDPPGRLTWNRDYVWRGGALLAQENLSGEAWHFSLDHLGSPRLVTRNGGVVLAQYELAPFGEEMSDTQGMPIGAEFFAFRFTGHERDHGATGTLDDLDYMHARHYTPHAGRFLQIDPVLGRAGSPQSWNRYAYAQNDPINHTDPRGLLVYCLTIEGQGHCYEVIEAASGTEPGDSTGSTNGFSPTPGSGYNPNYGARSGSSGSLQSVTITIISRILPNHMQAGMKSTQVATIDLETGEVTHEAMATGTTELCGINFPSRCDSFDTTTTKLDENKTKITMNGRTASSLYPSLINYNLDIIFDDSTGSYELGGTHDQYPAYEVWLGDVPVYGYQHGDGWWNLFRLIGSGSTQFGR